MTNPSDIPTFDRRAIPIAAHESHWTTRDGWKIRRIDWPPAHPGEAVRGSILFLPGRGDIYEKYLETLDHFHRRGWAVTASDWRGQGGSGRMGSAQYVGHADDFATWIDDLEQLWTDWKVRTPGPHILMAHSMGGHLSMRALAEKRVDPDAVVLSAPMLGLKGGGIPQWLGRAVFGALARIGDPTRAAWKVSEKPGSPLRMRQSLLTHDPDRYSDEAAWWDIRPELKMGPASVGWIKAALASTHRLERPGALEGIAAPVLMLVARHDQLVDASRAIRDAARLPDVELEVWDEAAAHELLREADLLRDEVIARIDDFLDKSAPASAPVA